LEEEESQTTESDEETSVRGRNRWTNTTLSLVRGGGALSPRRDRQYTFSVRKFASSLQDDYVPTEIIGKDLFLDQKRRKIGLSPRFLLIVKKDDTLR